MLPTIDSGLIKCSYQVEVYFKFRGIGVIKPPPAKFDLTMGVDSIYRELFAAEEEKEDLQGRNLRYYTSKSGMFSNNGDRQEEMFDKNNRKVRASDISVNNNR